MSAHALSMDEHELTRFRAKYRVHESGCWLWIAATKSSGYGLMSLRGKTQLAHRVALFLATGDDGSPNRMAAHSCNHTACVNPAHLRWATALENKADEVVHGTRTARAPNLRGRSARAQLVLSEEEKRLIDAAAAAVDMPMTHWVRSIVVPEARRILGGAR